MVTELVEASIKKLFSKKGNKEYNRIPTLDTIDVIKYESEGETIYKLSYLDLGDRFIFPDNLLEEVLTEYELDGVYEREHLTDYVDLDTMMRYEFARNKHMEDECTSILTGLYNKMNEPKKEKVLALDK